MKRSKSLPALFIFLSMTSCAAASSPYGHDYAALTPPRADPLMVGSQWSRASGFRPSALTKQDVENVPAGAGLTYDNSIKFSAGASLSSSVQSVISASLGVDYAKDAKISIGSVRLQRAKSLISFPIRDDTSVVVEAIYADRYTIQLSRILDTKASVAVTNAINQLDPSAQATIEADLTSVAVASPDSVIAVKLVHWRQISNRTERDGIAISSPSFYIDTNFFRQDRLQFSFENYSPAFPGCLTLIVSDLSAVGDSKSIGYCPAHAQVSGVSLYIPIANFSYPGWFNAYVDQQSDAYYFLQLDLSQLKFSFHSTGLSAPELDAVSGTLSLAVVAFRGSVDNPN